MKVNRAIKQAAQWAFIVGVLCWLLVSSARAGRWSSFWALCAIAVCVPVAAVVARLATGRTRREIVKNMTSEEKAALTRLAQHTGKELGIRVAPFAFVVAFVGMVFGITTLLITLVPVIGVSALLCRPVFRTARRQTTEALLASGFARSKGITTLSRSSQQAARG